MSPCHICLPPGVDGIRDVLRGWPADCPLGNQVQQKIQMSSLIGVAIQGLPQIRRCFVATTQLSHPDLALMSHPLG